MTTYKLIKNSAGETQFICRDDGASIPVCEGNRDYQQYLADAAAGVTVTEEILPDPLTDETPSLQDQINTLAYLMGST